MSSSSLSGMKEWAVFMDRGTKEIDDFLCGINDFRRVTRSHVNTSEANEVRIFLESEIDNLKRTKVEVRSNVLRLKEKSEELKLLLENTEAEKKKIRESLNNMCGVLRPGEPFTEDTSKSFLAPDLSSIMDILSLEPGTSGRVTFHKGCFGSQVVSPTTFSRNVTFGSFGSPVVSPTTSSRSFISGSFASQVVSPATSSSVMNESYVVVEVTPGLESRVPKSHLANQRDMVMPQSEKPRKPLVSGGRRMVQLTFSPSSEDVDTTAVSSRIYQIETPSQLVESKPSPNVILEKPKLPILSNYVYELLGVKYPKSLEQENTPPS